jgi:Xaa-Pro aminopeptidase
MDEKGFEAYMVTNGISIFYLSHFYHTVTERPAALIIHPSGKPVFMGPLLEIDHLKHQTPLIGDTYTYLDYPGVKHPMDLFAQWLTSEGLSNAVVGTDNPAGASSVYGYVGPPLKEKLPESQFIKDSNFLWQMRLIKSCEELQMIRESAKWGNLAHQYLQEFTKPGVWDTEITLRASLEASSTMKKALGPEYVPIRGGRAPASAGFRGQVGWKSAMPHSIGIKKTIEVGDVLVTGAGSDIGGYHSELERTMIVGAPTDKQKKMFKVMMEAQEAAIGTLTKGNSCADVDKAANKVIRSAGYEGLIRHHTGHGIGLQGHEPPYLDQGNNQLLEAGMVVSIEPGIYELGYAGFRHSDTLVVTEGDAEWITYYPRDIQSLTIL